MLITTTFIFYRIILEADSGAVVQRVALRTDDIPIGEQTVAQVNYCFYEYLNNIKRQHEHMLLYLFLGFPVSKRTVKMVIIKITFTLSKCFRYKTLT